MNKTSQPTLHFNILLGIVLLATLTRIAIPPFIDHPANFSAIDAIALFCGTYFSRRLIAFAVVLLAVWIGDILINKMFSGHWALFYSGFYWQYSCYLLITALGSILLKNQVKPLRLVCACFISAILFFVISNFGVWYSGSLYSFTLNGLITCYIAAIPFFKNTLFSDLFFSIILFGSFELIQLSLPNLVRRL